MKKSNIAIWKRDWFLALILSVLFLVFSQSSLLQSVERFAYDWGLRASSGQPSDRVAVIAIDDESINNIGRWPWSREIHAQMIDLLAEADAKVIGHTSFFFEPQRDPGLEIVEGIGFYLEDFGLASTDFDAEGNAVSIPGYGFDDLRTTINEEWPILEPGEDESPEAFAERQALSVEYLSFAIEALELPITELHQQVFDAVEALDVDQILANSIADAGNVLLPMFFYIGQPLGNPDQSMPAFVSDSSALFNIQDNVQAAQNGLFPLESIAVETPIDVLGSWASGVGHLNALLDVDGGIRSEPLVLDYYGESYPSLSLLLAAKSLNLSVEDISVKLGEGVDVGALSIGTDDALQMNTFFYTDQNGVPAFQVDSFYDVISGAIPASKYRDKIVLIGATAVGLGATQVTPVDPAMAPVVTLAHSVSSILNEDFFTTPSWSLYASLGAIVLVALFLMLILPRLNGRGGAVLTVGLFLILVATHYVLMTQQTMWVPLMIPAMLLVVGYTMLSTKQFLVTEAGKRMSDMESSESNRMLGLAFQSQGQLDMAFEKFRKCPKDEQIAEPVYNLALDFERKRQFAKAGACYQYIFDFSPQFKDVKERIERSKKMEDTVILGGSGGHAGGEMNLDTAEKPMLGRYQVQKELGKGAMGIVYLGVDPKINRTVAIKTMALSQEFEGDELEDVKERFFREAETAGRLNHPNIVTIYDAGEEHDLAFIAMEFLKGQDLAPQTKKDNLLSVGKAIDITLKCASALNYAHKQNVVHRDIKPANVMYDPESDELKITDFGIARITDSSKTKTGMVLGTPSYMSPEQLAGKKVDGRSDLFSLAVMLYQLLTGSLPFQAESMATLMYKITNDPHPRVREMNASLPEEFEVFFEKGLAKDVEERFQDGAEMAQSLKETIRKIKERQKG
jgi:eukaryotic-like serine/threonine-protein kinase